MTFNEVLVAGLQRQEAYTAIYAIENFKRKPCKFEIGDNVRIKDTSKLGKVTGFQCRVDGDVIAIWLNGESDNSYGFKPSDYRYYYIDELEHA